VSIDFSPKRWDRVKDTYRRWWANELDRPVLPVEFEGRDPGRPQPKAPLLCQRNCPDWSIPVDDLVDRYDWELSRFVYAGDAYPYVSLDVFGPGVMAAFLGSKIDTSTGGMWFCPPAKVPISELNLTYNPDNPWLRRVLDLCAAMMRRWQGQVLVSMPDLGGNLDVVSSFMGEDLLLALIDQPEHVVRVLNQVHDLWHKFYQQFAEALAPYNPGYTAWCGIYSDRPYYMLQCDFSYMISPDMYAQFVLPELTRSIARLGHAFYHLDGIGQLPHLDHLLSIKQLAGVQWVPGDGQPNHAHWPQIYQRIFAAGKKTQTWGDFDVLDALIAQTGAPGHIQHRTVRYPLDQQRAIRARLAKYGIDA
jgi:5-methyltetrahydrofolate--homocysteine methyltransferase